MRNINTVIFDLGGVLIDWNPEYVFLDAFEGDTTKMQWFLNNICTMAWNENQDAGYPLEKATTDLVEKFPEHEKYIRMYYGEWEKMLGGPIGGCVSILNSLVDNKDYKVVALTNWSSETFPIAKKRYEFLSWFEGIVVSGEEKTRKPFKEIYQIAIQRFDLIPEKTVFIDDNILNIEAANALGIKGIHFKNPAQLISELEKYNIQLS
ncbi:HAD family phosphatase [Hyunsoonleella sp. SJ7]|uniref:HAD family phosphatase n=1 Tax=Hyunsoonleella aquatilis TaxID=2762758 RepID=A0A923HBX6_9FLAO|nr:HAD family phosphatase [Hyunsoonleella aquatilis]MBC3759027.1 HAD family phosphatase [Hyunsoonleella aquatilis]